jgi:DNA-binding transcriptional LysR family regulator
MNISQLEILVAIAENVNMTEAAEAVGVTQSAVSHAIRKLEAELGVKLVERNRQGVALTSIGADIVQNARATLAQIDIIRQKSARERGLNVGKLRLGCVSSIPTRLLTGIMRDFRQRYPDIDVVLFEGTPQEITDWLDDGMIDVGTVASPEAYKQTTTIAQTEMLVLASSSHPFAQQEAITFHDLAKQSLIGPHADYGLMRQGSPLMQIPLPRLRHEVTTQTTIFAMVRENIGISILPAISLDADMTDLVARPLQPPLMFTAYLASPLTSPATEAFLDCAHTWAKQHGFLGEDSRHS